MNILILLLLIGYILFNLIGILKFKNNKIIDIYSFITLLILGGLNYSNPDYYNYYRSYELATDTSKVFIFKLIMLASKKIGLKYEVFLFIFIFINLYLIFKLIKKISLNRSFVYLFYIIYPFFFDVVQLKNFALQTITLYIYYYYIYYDISLKKFLLLNTLGLGFHEAALLNYPLILFRKKYKILLYSFLVFILGFLIWSRILKLEKMLFFLPSWKAENYASNLSNYGWIIYLFSQVILTLYIFINLKKQQNDNKNIKKLKKILIYSLSFIGFYFINGTFERMFRNIFIIIYIFIGNKYYKERKIKIFLSFFILIMSIWIFYLFRPYRETVLLEIINKNYLNLGRF